MGRRRAAPLLRRRRRGGGGFFGGKGGGKGANGGGKGGGGAGAGWRDAYVVLHGARLLCWRSEAALEDGLPADGQLLLRGHAGVTTPAPTDAVLCGASSRADAEARLVAVFGRGLDGEQARWGVLAGEAAPRAPIVAEPRVPPTGTVERKKNAPPPRGWRSSPTVRCRTPPPPPHPPLWRPPPPGPLSLPPLPSR